MIDRVNQYYSYPATSNLVRHFREEIGLTGKYLDIFNDLRSVMGSTQLHADNVHLPVKQYNDMAGRVGQRCISELIRLAEIGLETENRRNTG